MTSTTEPTSGALHLARAGVLGVVALGLAVAAHALAGGGLPGLAPLLVLTALTTASVLVLTTRRLTAPTLVAGLGALELVLHAGLTLLTASGEATVHAVGGGHHQALVVVDGAHVHHGSAPMLVAHAVATVLTALALAHGERLLWLALLAVAPIGAFALVRALRALQALVPSPAPAPAPAPRLVTRPWSLAAPRRGPPLPA